MVHVNFADDGTLLSFGSDVRNPLSLGRMMALSKSQYKGERPVFNANLCTKKRGKLWWGDLELTTDYTAISLLAQHIEEDVYVLREHDARFQNEDKPLFNRAVQIFYKDGTKGDFSLGGNL